ncbi:MAG: acyl carrier protein [Clostridia bacterium]|nr:acyl carrier protein [Clostridia bacterium]
MDELLDILSECCPDIDFEVENTLIDDGILSSIDLVTIVGELNDAYDISISVDDLTSENFNSAESILDLVLRLRDE